MVSLGLSRHIRSLIRTGSGLMIAALLLLMTMPFVHAQAAPEITIVSPKANDKITGKDINVTMDMKNVDNACKWVGLPDKDGQGHIHAMLDGMSMAQLTNFYCGTNSFTISGLGVKPGPHTLMVDIATNTHEDMDKTMKMVKFDYQPASPQAVPAAKKPASAPTAKINNLKDGAVLGPKFNLDIAADNFTPSADLEGKLNLEGYGHFHVFVDTQTHRLSVPRVQVLFSCDRVRNE